MVIVELILISNRDFAPHLCTRIEKLILENSKFCLELYGVHHRELSWFKSYLTNRKQFCRVNGVDSEIEDIEVGVPQGSCLGPLLFLVYINDLPQAVLDSNVSMYADDTSLCYQSHDMTRLNEAINSDLAKLDTWLQGNKLSLNVAKTHSMLISSKQKHNSILKGQNEDLKLKIRDNELEVVKKTKYLGLQIDCSLDWKEQIKAVSAKVSRAIGFLKHAKSFLPKETLQTLSIQVLWSLIFDTAVLSGAALVQVKLISYKNFKSVLLG